MSAIFGLRIFDRANTSIVKRAFVLGVQLSTLVVLQSTGTVRNQGGIFSTLVLRHSVVLVLGYSVVLSGTQLKPYPAAGPCSAAASASSPSCAYARAVTVKQHIPSFSPFPSDITREYPHSLLILYGNTLIPFHYYKGIPPSQGNTLIDAPPALRHRRRRLPAEGGVVRAARRVLWRGQL